MKYYYDVFIKTYLLSYSTISTQLFKLIIQTCLGHIIEFYELKF